MNQLNPTRDPILEIYSRWIRLAENARREQAKKDPGGNQGEGIGVRSDEQSKPILPPKN